MASCLSVNLMYVIFDNLDSGNKLVLRSKHSFLLWRRLWLSRGLAISEYRRLVEKESLTESETYGAESSGIEQRRLICAVIDSLSQVLQLRIDDA